MKLFVLCLIMCLHLSALAQTPDDDEVLIGIPDYPHRFFSGYLSVSVMQKPKNIHYVFFHSQNDINKDPLVLWFAGSPGCSGLLACFQENGPFVFKPGNHTFHLNPDAWNKNANLLYLEIPAGVGFSEGPEDDPITGEEAVRDILYSMRLFFARFPGMKKNQLYLAGHGYGAVFATYLSKQIIDENNDPFTIYNDDINLKGILMGNPCTAPDECYASGSEKHSFYHYLFLYNRAYFSKQTYYDFLGTCVLDYDGFPCYQKRILLNKAFNATNSSMYNIYDKCYKGSVDSSNLGFINTGCEDVANLVNYLNGNNTKDNWNIHPEKVWTPCNTKIYAGFIGPNNNSYWLYPYLIKNRIRIWVFSGDLDSFIPIEGTKKWIAELRHELEMPVKRIWREWWVPGIHKGEDQVGGFIWELRDLTFVSVKAAGFRSGADQPKAMSEILTGFLTGKTLPYKNV